MEVKNLSGNLIVGVLALIFLGCGFIFLILKITNKKGEKPEGFYQKARRPLYILHVGSSAVATILVFVNQTMITMTPIQILASAMLGMTLLILMIVGIVFIVITRFKLMDENQNKKYKSLRVIMWICAILVVIFLVIQVGF